MQKAAVDGERKRPVEVDLGPVRYLTTLLGGTDEQSMRWFILVVALLLEPAILLLAAATHRDAGEQTHRPRQARPAHLDIDLLCWFGEPRVGKSLATIEPARRRLRTRPRTFLKATSL